MSVIKDIQLNGSNLCNVECMDKNATLHPETCASQVLTTHTGPATLTDWLTYNQADPSTPLEGFESYSGLIPWLQHYYPQGSTEINPATTTTLGGVIIGSCLEVTNAGVLSVDTSQLPEPEIPSATVETSGTIKLGNRTVTDTSFSYNNTLPTIADGRRYMLPLRLDSYNRAGIELDKAVIQDYIFPEGIPTISNAEITFTQGENSTTITLNQDSDVTIKFDDTTYDPFTSCTQVAAGRSGLVPAPATTDYNKVLSSSNGWVALPTTFEGCTEEQGCIAGLVPAASAGDQDKFLCADGTWSTVEGVNYSAGAGISISSSVIAQTLATNNSLGGIKLGYVKNENRKAVDIDENGKAFVDTEQHPTVAGLITNGLHTHFFRPSRIINPQDPSENLQDEFYIPIIYSTSNNVAVEADNRERGKMSVVFEIFGREDSGTYYAKYYANCCNTVVYADLMCLSFYSKSDHMTNPSDIVMVMDKDGLSFTIYKKEIKKTNGMFIVNVLAENSTTYGVQTYYNTRNDSEEEISLKFDDGISYDAWENDVDPADKVYPTNISYYDIDNIDQSSQTVLAINAAQFWRIVNNDSVLHVQLHSLPTEDPGVEGVLYESEGVLMVSHAKE